MANIRWAPVLERAADIVRSYATGVTLRQLFYRLVADGTLPNTQNYYRRLSSTTAAGRRAGTFPDLLDRTSRIEEPLSFESPEEARAFTRNVYRRNRTEGQPWTVILGVEKAGMSAQLDAWLTDPLGIPHVALGGYASQTLTDDVRRYIEEWDRPTVLVYAGDHDPSGEDIDRDFIQRVGAFDKVIRVALSPEQVTEYNLPENPTPEVEAKLRRDPRGAAFEQRHGSLVQFEVDALDPEVLRDLYRNALNLFWDEEAFEEVLEREEREKAGL
jgi:hypothetical protein